MQKTMHLSKEARGYSSCLPDVRHSQPVAREKGPALTAFITCAAVKLQTQERRAASAVHTAGKYGNVSSFTAGPLAWEKNKEEEATIRSVRRSPTLPSLSSRLTAVDNVSVDAQGCPTSISTMFFFFFFSYKYRVHGWPRGKWTKTSEKKSIKR
jgi:hypothetical protein